MLFAKIRWYAPLQMQMHASSYHIAAAIGFFIWIQTRFKSNKIEMQQHWNATTQANPRCKCIYTRMHSILAQQMLAQQGLACIYTLICFSTIDLHRYNFTKQYFTKHQASFTFTTNNYSARITTNIYQQFNCIDN